MFRFSAVFIAVCAVACGAPAPEDPRHAEIVVDSPELEPAVRRAAAWWKDATDAEVKFRVVSACGPGVVCEHVVLGELPSDEGGLTAYPIGHPENVTTTISVRLDPALTEIDVAHELGHVLGLGHTDGVMTSCLNDASWLLPSEWVGVK